MVLPPGFAGSDAEPVRVEITPIAPGLAVVVQLSLTEPYVGQQFTALYSLRAIHAPYAVDVDPQQYVGFWTEVVPLPEQGRSAQHFLNGVPATDYLLRQVVAYPLYPGRMELPPLRVKVKRSAAGPEEWDLTSASQPVPLTVHPLPNFRGAGSTVPLVGDMDGSLEILGRGEKLEIALELYGTTNLAFFNPLQWLPKPDCCELSVRLLLSEDSVRTRDMGGKREVFLFKRRRWSIKTVGRMEAGTRLGDFAIPVFQPRQSEWVMLRFTGASRAGPSSERAAVGDLPRELPLNPTKSTPAFLLTWAHLLLAAAAARSR